ncbi:MAG: YfhO family protein, partial [Acidimicrobiales bacterium]
PIGTVGPGPADRNGLIPFPVPAPLPPGRYGFEARCPSCRGTGDRVPRVVFTAASPGNFLVADRLVTDLVAAFSPIYTRLAPLAASTAKLTTTRIGAGRWDIDVDAARPQLVVVAEANFPGWHAGVDGHHAPVVTADVAFVGVPVPAGHHHLTLRYRAPGVTFGDWLSGLTVLICAAVFMKPKLWPRIRDGLQTAMLDLAAASDS